MKKKYKSFKIITANNVCAHIPDIRDFVLGVRNILEPDGLFVFEVSYLKDVIKKLTFDTIYHEHMSYHSLKPLLGFFENLGMSVLDFDLVEAQGGSIRIYVGHKNKKIKKNKINKQVKMEEKLGLLDEKLFRKFHKRIQKQKKMITKIIYRNIIKKKKTLIGYGAPAKVTTFCHVFNLGVKSIEEIVDDNPLKHNRYTPGKNIKIISFKELKKIKFDYIIILAWNFAPSIIKKLRKFIRKPFKIITPFPRVTIE